MNRSLALKPTEVNDMGSVLKILNDLYKTGVIKRRGYNVASPYELKLPGRNSDGNKDWLRSEPAYCPKALLRNRASGGVHQVDNILGTLA